MSDPMDVKIDPLELYGRGPMMAAIEAIRQDNGGLRNGVETDPDKEARYDLMPPEAMDALARHFQRGITCSGYPERNWERGMSWCKCFGSLMRHAWKWLRGEDYDTKTGTHHMICVAWNAFALYTYHARNAGTDDRPVKTEVAKPTAPPHTGWDVV